jgi:hypothetical protein
MQIVHILQLDSAGTDSLPKGGFLQGNPNLLLNGPAVVLLHLRTNGLNLLIKFVYVVRTPPSPKGHHRYGISVYLVRRAKPGCLGRLIVDFSPVNQLIESPSAAFPVINNTLQFLQGKVMYCRGV